MRPSGSTWDWTGSLNMNQPKTHAGFQRQNQWHRVFLLCCSLAVVTCLSGCRREAGTVLGKSPSGEVRNIIAVRAGETPPRVTLKGQMVEKCPVAGCWFYLQDDTGTIKVDTKTAGFVVVNVPLHSKVTVSGTVVSQSEDVSLQATGLRY
jgi:uncharacterized protein YdeI (BOF family)